MEVFAWISTHGADVLATVGMITGWAFTIHTIHQEKQARRIGNMLEITKQHRELWKEAGENPNLSRITQDIVDLAKQPVTVDEQRFVNDVVLHLHMVREAMKVKMFVELEGLEPDANQFFNKPIPKAVWDSLKHYQNGDFVAFVETIAKG